MWLLPPLLLLLVPGSSADVMCPEEVRGPAQSLLIHRCRYDPGSEPYVKFWCRGADFRNCTILVRTNDSRQWVKGDRVSIRDNQTSHTFTVTMEKLRPEDADIYWCGIEKNESDRGVPVKVSVGPGRAAAITGPEEVSGPEQGSLTVRCCYAPGWELYVKYWCRGADWDTCEILVRTDQSQRGLKKGRVSIKDARKSRVFTVTMEELTQKDADTYWCGIERIGTDYGFPIKVAVGPEPVTEAPTSSLTVSGLHPTGRSLLSNVHFLLLVFLKLPLFLSMLGAVLWVNRPQRGSAGGGLPHSENQ